MCTAVSFLSGTHYFGRNLDVTGTYGEQVVITPRNFPIRLRHLEEIKRHYAIIGMALVKENYPLYFDATNEKGLSIAGLAFAKNCFYREREEGKENTASFEFIPRVLALCQDVEEAITLIGKMNITGDSFMEEMPPEPLHFLISDKNSSIVVEPMAGGIFVHYNKVGVLTNNPPFPIQLMSLNKYARLAPFHKVGDFAKKTGTKEYSTGMGTIGLPGDLTSESRFVRAVFAKENILSDDNEQSRVSGFFHILSSVSQIKGLNILSDKRAEYTLYSSCCNTAEGIYYYRTYENSRTVKISMRKENLETPLLYCYPLVRREAFSDGN